MAIYPAATHGWPAIRFVPGTMGVDGLKAVKHGGQGATTKVDGCEAGIGVKTG
jgi:hypothetical protein